MFRLRLMFLPIAAALLMGAGPADDGRLYAGGYSYSDELGGFKLISASGIGTRADPVEIVQELRSASPVTMVIRADLPVRPHGTVGRFATGMLHLRLVTLNASGLPWLEYELELQEQLGVASVFGDGLSFDQRRTDSENVGSSHFSAYSRDFEPYDRLLFRDGSVDPLQTASFRFFITDFTPKQTFYLKQDPNIPFS